MDIDSRNDVTRVTLTVCLLPFSVCAYDRYRYFYHISSCDARLSSETAPSRRSKPVPTFVVATSSSVVVTDAKPISKRRPLQTPPLPQVCTSTCPHKTMLIDAAPGDCRPEGRCVNGERDDLKTTNKLNHVKTASANWSACCCRCKSDYGSPCRCRRRRTAGATLRRISSMTGKGVASASLATTAAVVLTAAVGLFVATRFLLVVVEATMAVLGTGLGDIVDRWAGSWIVSDLAAMATALNDGLCQTHVGLHQSLSVWDRNFHNCSDASGESTI